MNDIPFNQAFALAIVVVVLVMLLAMAVLGVMVLGPWLRAFTSGAPISVVQLLGMRLRGVPPGLIVDALVTLVHRGLSHDPRRCGIAESIYLAQRGLIHSPEQLADLVEKQLPDGEPR
ncbi:MAG TPA: flotillin-like FloA family protein [Pirellulaceae bacterium]|nr:flotillin-like FloA family protein [Pirellulaceae bacterium]